MNSKLLLGLGMAGSGAVLAYDQGIIGGSSKEKEKDDPATIMSSPMAGGTPGLGAVSQGGTGSKGPTTKVTVEAPKIQTEPAVEYTDDTGGDSKKQDKSEDSGSSDSSTSTDISTSKAPEPVKTADSDDPMSKKVEAPGVQSEDPAEVTQELNLEQGRTRTIHDKERKGKTQFETQLEDAVNGNSKKETKQSSSGSSGPLDTVGNFFTDTIGWGEYM